MSKKHPSYDESFKIEAVRQVVERGYPVREVADRLGVGLSTLHSWRRKYGKQVPAQDKGQEKKDVQAEIAKLKAELKRVTEERDILKKAAAYFAKQSQ